MDAEARQCRRQHPIYRYVQVPKSQVWHVQIDIHAQQQTQVCRPKSFLQIEEGHDESRRECRLAACPAAFQENRRAKGPPHAKEGRRGHFRKFRRQVEGNNKGCWCRCQKRCYYCRSASVSPQVSLTMPTTFLRESLTIPPHRPPRRPRPRLQADLPQVPASNQRLVAGPCLRRHLALLLVAHSLLLVVVDGRSPRPVVLHGPSQRHRPSPPLPSRRAVVRRLAHPLPAEARLSPRPPARLVVAAAAVSSPLY